MINDRAVIGAVREPGGPENGRSSRGAVAAQTLDKSLISTFLWLRTAELTMAEWRPTKPTVDSGSIAPGQVPARLQTTRHDGPLDILGPGVNAPEFVNTLRSRMGVLARMKTDRVTEKEVRRIAGEITVEIFNAQKAVMIDKITAGVALEKRATLAAFMREAVKGDEEIRSLLESAQKQMMNAAESEAVVILTEKTKKISDIRSRQSTGAISEKDCDDMVSLYERNTEELLRSKFAIIGQLSLSYQEHFRLAMTQYEERTRAVADRLLSS